MTRLACVLLLSGMSACSGELANNSLKTASDARSADNRNDDATNNLPNDATTMDATGANLGSELPRPVRIMPLGDSITLGMHGPGADWDVNKSLRGGYRAKLAEQLAQWGVQFDMVGNSDAIDSREQISDNGHEGHGGWCLTGGNGACYADIVAPGGNGGISAHIGEWLSAAQPHIILLHIGTNDFNGGDSVPDVLAHYATFLDQIFALNPAVYVIVSALRIDGSAVTEEFNPQLQSLVSQKAAAGQNVWFVDTYQGTSSPLGEGGDTLHPSLANYEVLGENWYLRLREVLPGLANN